MSLDRIKRAIDIANVLVGLGTRIFDALARGEIDRVEDLLPEQMLTDLRLKKAEIDARLRYRS